MRESRAVNQITALNDATRNLVASLQAQIVSLNNSFAACKRTSEETLVKLADSNQGLVEQLQDLPGKVGLALAGGLVQEQPINHPPPPC
jgi:DNA uptake protein ComE-like DNA-binding protein